MNWVYALEPPRSLELELRALIPDHMAEFGASYGFATDPDYEAYWRLADQGALVAVTARVSGALVGYWFGLKFNDPHHVTQGRKVSVLMSQAHHILPEWRARIAPGFFRYIETVARGLNVDLLAQRTRPGERTEGFFKAIEYQMSETIHVKRLQDA